jgi:hypothetical protein
MDMATICSVSVHKKFLLYHYSHVAHLVWTGNDAGKVGFALTLDHGLQNRRVVGAQVDEAMRDAGVPDRLEEGCGRSVAAL